MGFNTMADALEKAGIRNTNIPQKPVRKQYQKSSEFDPVLREQLNFAKQVSSSVIVESNNYVEKHYTNPILEDAASHVRFIQNKIDNIEKIDTELRVLSKDLKYDFLTADQNSRLVTAVQNFLANEKIRMQDELSALLYNTQYINNAPVEVEPLQLSVNDIVAPIETTIKVSTPKKNKVTVYRSMSELSDDEKQKIKTYLEKHTKDQTSKKFNVSKYTLNSISNSTGIDILNATRIDIINHYRRFGNIGTLTKDLHVSYEKARRVLIEAGIYSKKK